MYLIFVDFIYVNAGELDRLNKSGRLHNDTIHTSEMQFL